MLSSLKCSLPKVNGYYHPLAISFPDHWIPWSNIGFRPPKANGHYHPLAISSPGFWIPWSVTGIRFPEANGHCPPWALLDIILPEPFSDIVLPEQISDVILPEQIFGRCPPRKFFGRCPPRKFFGHCPPWNFFLKNFPHFFFFFYDNLSTMEFFQKISLSSYFILHPTPTHCHTKCLPDFQMLLVCYHVWFSDFLNFPSFGRICFNNIIT